MKYVHSETGEIWVDSLKSTSRTSNFYLLTHDEKVAMGWELVAEPPIVEKTLAELKAEKLAMVKEAARTILENEYPLETRVDAALGLMGAAAITAMKTRIQEVRTQFNTYKDMIQAGNLDFEVTF